MAQQSAPVFDRIRIVPRPEDFLNRNTGSSGEIFYNQATNSLRVYSDKNVSGFEIARADLVNIDNETFAAKAEAAGVGGGGGGSGGGASVDVSANPPADPAIGNIWLNSVNGSLYVYIADEDSSQQWIQPAVPTFSGSYNDLTDAPTVPSDISDLTDNTSLLFSGSYNDLSNLPTSYGLDTLEQGGATNGQVLTWSDSNNQWEPAAGGGGAGSVGNFLFESSVIDTDDSSGITITPSVTTQSDLTVENDLVVRNNFQAQSVSAEEFINNGVGPAVLESGSTLTLSSVDGIILDGLTILDSTTETVGDLGSDLAGGATFDCDLANNGVFYADGAAGNFTVNITNVPTDNFRATSIAVVVVQGGASSGLPTSLEIGGVSQTINWESGITPTSATSVTQIVSFTLIRYASTWNVIGSMTSYG